MSIPARSLIPPWWRLWRIPRTYGTPRLESQAIRAHVPAVLRTFADSWQQVFREGVLDHRIKELARVFVAKSLECGYCAGQRRTSGPSKG